MADNNLQVNVNFSNDPELLKILEAMVREDMMDRSKFMRKLVMQESMRRIRATEVREQGMHAPLNQEMIPIAHSPTG